MEPTVEYLESKTYHLNGLDFTLRKTFEEEEYKLNSVWCSQCGKRIKWRGRNLHKCFRDAGMKFYDKGNGIIYITWQ